MEYEELDNYQRYFVDIMEYEDYEIEEEYKQLLCKMYGDQDDEGNEIRKWR